MLQESGELPEVKAAEENSGTAVSGESAGAAQTGGNVAVAEQEQKPKPAQEEKSQGQEFHIGTPPQSSASPALGRLGGTASEAPAAPAASPAAASSSEALPPAESGPASSSQEDDAAWQRKLGEAFPVDKMQNGLSAARGFMSWGFSRVAETATKLGDDIAESEFAKGTSKLVADAEEVVSTRVSEASKMAEAGLTRARTGLEQIQQDLQPTISETQERARAAASGIAMKVEPMAETVKPKLDEAKEAARAGFFGALSQAARTAIWFQSLGSHRDDSDDEDEEFARSPLSDEAAKEATSAAASSSRPAGAGPGASPAQDSMIAASTGPPKVEADKEMTPAVAERPVQPEVTVVSEVKQAEVEQTAPAAATPAADLNAVTPPAPPAPVPEVTDAASGVAAIKREAEPEETTTDLPLPTVALPTPSALQAPVPDADFSPVAEVNPKDDVADASIGKVADLQIQS